MTTETVDTATSGPARFTTTWCRIESCARPIDGNLGGPYCWAHRRTFKFSASLNDALAEFLNGSGNSMRPSKFNGADIREAGEHFAQGLSRLFGAAFGTTVTVRPQPITPTSVEGRGGWHVALRWQEDEGESSGCAAMDETDDSDYEYNDDVQDEHNEGTDDE